MLKTKFKFGQMVKVKGYLTRHKGVPIGTRYWHRDAFPVPIQALFLGGRKLANGKAEFESYVDEGANYVFNPTEYLNGALVCQENRNPIKVLLDDIEAID